MTRVILLRELKEYIEKRVSNLSLPEAVQKGDIAKRSRPPDVYTQRIPNSDAAKKYVPYILAQFVTGTDKQEEGDEACERSVQIRLIFAVYGEDEQEGSMTLLNLMDTVEIGLLEDVIIGKAFKLDTEEGIDSLVYPDDTAPYYAGEMVCTFLLPAIKRKVDLINGF